MPSSNLRPPSGWPAAWTQALDYLAAGLDTDYVLASAGTRQALATDMRKAQAMRESLYAFPSWPGPVKAMLRTHKIRLERRFTFGRWFLHICAEPLRPDLSQMFLLALQNPAPPIDMSVESPDDGGSPAPDTAHRQAP